MLQNFDHFQGLRQSYQRPYTFRAIPYICFRGPWIRPPLTNSFIFCITGRIVNRFSSDLYTVDDSLPFILNIFLAQVVGVIGPIVVTTYAVPWIIIGTYIFFIKCAFQRKEN